ncbi:MAG TPA: hypothetical protein VMT94_04850 [Burkholderiales bacterium]|nr:hypothetical protein [Burkholderiales bacterium]
MDKSAIKQIESIITSIAIIVGGFWTYDLFVKERQNFPHAKMEQKISHVGLSPEVNLLRVEIDLSNTGSSRLVIDKSQIYIQKILPLASCEHIDPKNCVSDQIKTALRESDRDADSFAWPLIAQREANPEMSVEPDETDFLIVEFAVPSSVKVVRVYSYLRNDKVSKGGDEIGWRTSSFYDFRTVRTGDAK